MRERKLAGLDVLRGVAIILVVAAHYSPSNMVSLIASEYAAFAGVILFFLLSGFLMDQTTAGRFSLSEFVIRRAGRILPMYFVSMLAVYVIKGPFDLWTVLSNATFTSDLLHTSLMMGVFWTLYIEVRFYALVPLLRWGGDGIIKIAPYIAIAANSILYARYGSASHVLLFMTYCLVGMQISLWHRGLLSAPLLVVCVAVASIGVATFTKGHPLVGVAMAGGASAIAIAVSSNLRFRLLAFFGLISYSWYLTHSLVRHLIVQIPSMQTTPAWLTIVYR